MLQVSPKKFGAHMLNTDLNFLDVMCEIIRFIIGMIERKIFFESFWGLLFCAEHYIAVKKKL